MPAIRGMFDDDPAGDSILLTPVRHVLTVLPDPLPFLAIVTLPLLRLALCGRCLRSVRAQRGAGALLVDTMIAQCSTTLAPPLWFSVAQETMPLQERTSRPLRVLNTRGRVCFQQSKKSPSNRCSEVCPSIHRHRLTVCPSPAGRHHLDSLMVTR